MNIQELKKLKSKYDASCKVGFEIITPDIAQNYLNKNLNNSFIRNRTINQKTVNRLAKDIIDGNWYPENDSIKFNSKDVMVDGQHTCTAVVKANKPILRLVARGVSEDAFKSLNSGKQRTHKDVLTTIILPNGQKISKPAVVSVALNAMECIKKRLNDIDRNRKYSNTEIADIFMERWEFYTEPLDKIEIWYVKIGKRINQGWLAAFYYLNKDDVRNNDDKNIDDFLNILCNGDGNYPLVRWFREMIAENKNLSNDHKNKLSSLGIINTMSALFKYYHENKLPYLRNIKKSDLNLNK